MPSFISGVRLSLLIELFCSTFFPVVDYCAWPSSYYCFRNRERCSKCFQAVDFNCVWLSSIHRVGNRERSSQSDNDISLSAPKA